MIQPVKEYLTITADMIGLATAALESVRSGQNAPRLARSTAQTLGNEARRARKLAALPRQAADDRKALEAFARDASRLKGEAMKLC